jgi:hypothetical protein
LRAPVLQDYGVDRRLHIIADSLANRSDHWICPALERMIPFACFTLLGLMLAWQPLCPLHMAPVPLFLLRSPRICYKFPKRGDRSTTGYATAQAGGEHRRITVQRREERTE